jgi:hypothetical protein
MGVGVRVWGWNKAQQLPRARSLSGGRALRQSAEKTKKTQVLERVIRRSRIFVQPQTDTGSSILYFSNMVSVLCCVVQYRRPNGWTDWAKNWHKHPLGLCDEDRWVGDRECALMHHISSIGGQATGPVEPQIGTNTHWSNGQKLWGSAVACAH